MFKFQLNNKVSGILSVDSHVTGEGKRTELMRLGVDTISHFVLLQLLGVFSKDKKIKVQEVLRNNIHCRRLFHMLDFVLSISVLVLLVETLQVI